MGQSHPRGGWWLLQRNSGRGGGEGCRLSERQSSLRAFQYMARAFEVAGLGCSRARGGTHLRGVPRCGVRGAIDSSFNLVATHPSSRPELREGWRWGGGRRDRRRKRKKKDLTAKGWLRVRPRGVRDALTYLNVSSRETKTTTANPRNRCAVPPDSHTLSLSLFLSFIATWRNRAARRVPFGC